MKTASYHTFSVVAAAAKTTPATVCATVWRWLMRIRKIRALQAAAVTVMVAGCTEPTPNGNTTAPSSDMRNRVACVEKGGVVVYGYKAFTWLCAFPAKPSNEGGK